MIITKEEFYEMGFEAEAKYESLLEKCILRAEYVLNGLTNGTAGTVALSGTKAAEFVKQAAAFQTNDLLKEEIALAKSQSESSSSENSKKSDERVSIGDFSYSSGTSSSESSKSSSSSSEEAISRLDTGKTVIRLLRAAGCLYTGAEVKE